MDSQFRYGRIKDSIKKIIVFLMFILVTNDRVYCENNSYKLYSINIYNLNETDEISTAIPDFYSDYGIIDNFKIGSKDCVDKYNCSQDGQTFPEKRCHCDKLCGLMNDCCVDHHHDPISYVIKEQFECVALFAIVKNKDYGISMVTKCSSSWDQDEIKSMCESSANINDNLLRLPVSDKTENHVMFKNMFCAICNFINDFYFWMQAIKCRNETSERILPGMEECNLIYIRPKPYISYRACQLSKSIASSCNVSVKSISVKEEDKCKNGIYALTYDNMGQMYRNKYCAMCNGVEEDSMYCVYFEPITNLKSDTKIPYSLRRILDTNTCQISQSGKLEDVCNANEVLVITNDFSEKCVGIPGASYGGCGVKVTSNRVELVFYSEVVERYLTLAGLVLSIISLIFTLIIYLSIPKLLNNPGKFLVSLIISLLSAQVMYIVAPEVENLTTLCIVVGIFVHYFFLVAFCWMNVIAFDLWKTFSKRVLTTESENKWKKSFVIYSLYAWLLPSCIVGIAVVFDYALSAASIEEYKPKYGNTICWISSRNALIIFFAGPFSVFKLFDIIAFIGTAFAISRTKRQGAMARRNTPTCSFLINIKLSVIMGLTWIFAFIGNLTNSASIWYMFIIFNSLQGLFIAICFLCNKRLIRLISNRFTSFSSKDSNGAKQVKERM